MEVARTACCSLAIFTSGMAGVLAVFSSRYKQDRFVFSWARIVRVSILGIAIAMLVALSLGKFVPTIPHAIDVTVGGVAGIVATLFASQTRLAT